MQIKLHQLSIENFKGVHLQLVDFSDRTMIAGKNGTGKTTIYDAFLWLLFGKDSTGRKDFEVRPLNNNNVPIKGIVTSVTGTIIIDGIEHVLCKRLEENVIKDQLRGYTTLCTIDEVPKKVSEYADFINSMLDEDQFKLLTDLHYFNSTLHWTARRAMLLQIAGDIGTPDGFDDLLDKLNGRSLKDYKDVLLTQKKRLVKERDEINPRIDEIRRNLNNAPPQDNSVLQKTRAEFQEALADLESARQSIVNAESRRQQQIDNLNSLKTKRIEREGQLKNDTGGIKHLLDEKAEIESGVASKKNTLASLQSNLFAANSILKSKQMTVENCLRALQSIGDEYRQTKTSSDPDICSLCGQKLPEDKLAELQTKKEAMLKHIEVRGDTAKAALKKAQADFAESEVSIKTINADIEKAQIELNEAEAYKAEHFAQIDPLLKSNQPTSPLSDELWVNLNNEIKRLESSIGPSAGTQAAEIENKRNGIVNDIATLDKALANADRAKQDLARIAELEKAEKKYAQQIADVDAQLASIGEFIAAESTLIESAVNSRFKWVKFKLFNTLLNGTIEDCCEAVFVNGVPYTGMSGGQKIVAGIDIVNVLSKHFNYSVPLFCDNAESLTYENESTSQTIMLYAKAEQNELTISNYTGETENGNNAVKTSTKTSTSTKRTRKSSNANAEGLLIR